MAKIRNYKTRLGLLMGSVAASSMALTPVAAQGSAETAQGTDIITVTALRREQSIQDVPASVSAIGEEDLKQAGVLRLDDLQSSFPNVYLNSDTGLRSTVITIRGISSEPNNPGVDQAVGVFIDGVFLGRPTAINTGVYDIERVEVVRGPQGALYGRNTIAGAINLITRGPDLSGNGGVEGAFSYGNNDAISGYAAAEAVLVPDVLGARASFSIQKRDGFVENAVTGDDLGNIDDIGGRLAIIWRPTSSINVSIRGDAGRTRSNGDGLEVVDNGVLAGLPFADADPYDRIIAVDRQTQSKREVYGVSGQIDWETGIGDVTSITAYRTFDWVNLTDNDYTILNQLSSGISEDHTQFSQELRLATPTGEFFEGLIGAFYSNEKLKTSADAYVGPDLGIYPDEVAAIISADVKTRSAAVFAQGTLNLTDQLSVTAAGRMSWDKKEVDHSTIGDPFQILMLTQPLRTLERSDSEFTPSGTVSWRPTEEFLVYGTVARGYKTGGYDVFSILPTDDAEYDPEFVTNYEIGVRTTLLDGRLLANVSMFKMDYKNLQVNQLTLVGGLPVFQTSNAATANIYGVEFDAKWAATDFLDFGAALAVQEANFDDFRNANQAGDDYSGNRLTQAPKFSATFSGSLHQPVTSSINFTAYSEVVHRSKIFFDPENLPHESEGPVTLVNARAGFESSDQRWSLVVWGRNLTDKDYATDVFAGAIIPGQVIQRLAPPRTYGVEVTARF